MWENAKSEICPHHPFSALKAVYLYSICMDFVKYVLKLPNVSKKCI